MALLSLLPLEVIFRCLRDLSHLFEFQKINRAMIMQQLPIQPG